MLGGPGFPRKADPDTAHQPTMFDRVLRSPDEPQRSLRQTELVLARARLPRRQTASLTMFAWGMGTARHLCGVNAEVAMDQSIRSTRSVRSAPSEGRERS